MKKLTSLLTAKRFSHMWSKFLEAPEHYWHYAVIMLSIVLISVIAFDAYTFFGLAQGPTSLPEPEIRTQKLHTVQFREVLNRLEKKRSFFTSPAGSEDAYGLFRRISQ